MNKNLCLVAMAMVIIALNFGCSKSSSSSGSSQYYMKCSINGTANDFSNCVIDGNSGSNSYWEFIGFNGAVGGGTPNLAFELKVYNNTTGTFAIDSLGGTNYAIYVPQTGTAKISKSGTLTISSVSPFMGSYNFTCKDGTVITGSFEAR